MKANYIDHIGIAVKCLEKSVPYYERLLEKKCYAIELVEDQFVKTAFFLIGQTKLELIESTDLEGHLGSYIENRGEGIHHIAFAVDKTDEALNDAKANGFALIDPRSRKGAENMNIGFLYPKSTHGILVELCSK